MSTPTPTPSANPYGPQLAAPAPNAMSSGGAVPAPVPTTTASSVIADNLAAAELQNRLIANAGGRRGGSRKQKRSRNKHHKNRHKRTNRSNRSNRSRRHRRSKRGGATTPSISPRPTATVPQFGSMHAGANTASVNLNSGAMGQTAQAKYDVNGPSTTTYFQ